MTSYEAQQEALAAAKAFVPIAKEHFPYSAVYLFGSCAKGYANEHSDIDVAVIIPDYGDMTPEEIRLAMRDLWMRGGRHRPPHRTGRAHHARRIGVRESDPGDGHQGGLAPSTMNL